MQKCEACNKVIETIEYDFGGQSTNLCFECAIKGTRRGARLIEVVRCAICDKVLNNLHEIHSIDGDLTCSEECAADMIDGNEPNDCPTYEVVTPEFIGLLEVHVK